MVYTLEKFKINIIAVFCYLLYSVVFLVKLSKLNSILLDLEKSGERALDILQYQSSTPVIFFFQALLLELGGAALLVFCIKSAIEKSENFSDILVSILMIIIVLIIAVLIIKLISIPILKLILTVVTLGIGILMAATTS